MTKTISNKQFVLEVAKIMTHGTLFDGDISKQVLLEKLDEKFNPKPCSECNSKPGYHTLDCKTGGFVGFHPAQ